MEMTTMQIDRAAVEQALEALKRLIGGSEYEEAIEAEQAITALRAAPAHQAEPVEPVAWVNQANLASARLTRDRGGQGDTHTWSETRSNYHGVPLYTAPPQRKPLTLEDAQTLLKAERIWLSNNTAFRITRAVERAHGIKEN